MSPAGYWPQLDAAVEAGADAIYFGLNHFSARAKVGFTLAELPNVMRTLHQRGVRGYVTFNTLVFDHELREAARALAAIAAAGADAIIVQDLGIAALACRIAPELEVHGSTQMSITSAEGVALAQRVGVSRVVLARELSLSDIRKVRATTNVELEMFVHGALCVSYSGQCFSSEAWGGRSANRGQCAQACRLPYDLIVDGQRRPLGDARYLLSPGDLYALPLIPEIVQIGISALKIEGRYKDAEYVALTTQAYRAAVDAAWNGMAPHPTPPHNLQLTQVYSRGLGPFFLSGTNHQAVVRGRAPRHRGVLMGQVTRVLPQAVQIRLEPGRESAPLKAGDGVVFDAADWRSPEEAEEGGRIYQVFPLSQDQVELRFAHDALQMPRIRVGDLLWRTSDGAVTRAARPFLQPAAPVQRQSVAVHVRAAVAAPLELTWHVLDTPFVVTVRSSTPLGAAQKRALDANYLREQLGRLGDTPYRLAELTLDCTGQPFAPSSLLNQLRREATDALQELQGTLPTRHIAPPETTLATLQQSVVPSTADTQAPPHVALHLLVRTPEQLAAAIELRPASITLDYLELYGLRPAVEQIQAAGIEARVASPRVLKPDEERVVHFLRKLDCAIVVRSTGLLHTLASEPGPRLIGDFSLNAANQITADMLIGMGLHRITPTYDLNAAQIADLTRTVGAAQIEVVVYQHLPVFHTEHCVFCRFLSAGTSYKDCGHPCETHRIALRDAQGRQHPVMADVGCRNTVFGAEAQEASRHLDTLRSAGVCHMRLEFVHEGANEVRAITEAFTAALRDEISANELNRRLQAIAPQGTTEGSLFVANNYLSVPLMQ
jgi:putative protease